MVDKFGNKTGGRKKGVPNQMSTRLRNMILEILLVPTYEEALEINPYLADLKHNYPPVFAGLLSKMLPKEQPIEVAEKVKQFKLNMIGLKPKSDLPSTLPALPKIGADAQEVADV